MISQQNDYVGRNVSYCLFRAKVISCWNDGKLEMVDGNFQDSRGFWPKFCEFSIGCFITVFSSWPCMDFYLQITSFHVRLKRWKKDITQFTSKITPLCVNLVITFSLFLIPIVLWPIEGSRYKWITTFLKKIIRCP